MNKVKALKVLIAFNAWRRGAEIPMPCPTLIGKAIDAAIEHMRKKKAKK